MPKYSRLYVSAFIMALLLALSVLAVLQFAQKDYQREVQNWQTKLSLIADSRLHAVDGWLEQQFGEMRKLASHDAVADAMRTGEMAVQIPAEDIYLRHLLSITAERSGFSPAMEGGIIGGNPPPANGGGIALLDMKGAVRVATAYMPPVQGMLADFVARAVPAQPNMFDVTASADNAVVRMGFLVPVYATQMDNSPSQQLGWVFGVRAVGAELFGLLRHPGMIESSLENILVREENGGITYLSPLVDGTKPLRKHLAMPENVASETALAEAYAMREPGQFAVRTDYRQRKVLATGRLVPGTNWSLVTKVDESEALDAAKSKRNSLIKQLLLGVAAVFALVVAAWRHGTSRDATRLASRLQTALHKAETREQMLDIITNTQPGAIFIVDEAGKCCFANDAFAEETGLPRKDAIGRKLDVLRGATLAEEYERASEVALEEQKTISWTHRAPAEDGEKITRIKHIPLNQLPMEDAPAGARGVLVLEQDITAVVVERERRTRTLRSLVDTLVKMVDRRDPYAANHSRMVATIACEVAREMELEPLMLETAEIAGTVMNIGKMEVPAEWLTKAGALNEQERAAIRAALLDSAGLLENIEFDGPVAETLRQTLENWDGSGPRKLKGEEILVTARIVAAANAFVGMVSPRSYRKAILVEEALDMLMKGIGKEFDRKVVVALANYIDNRGGRAMITTLAQAPEKHPV